jgi:type I restriction enzyme M protein
MEHDGFSLDDKRQPTDANDIPDVLQCWENRSDAGFNAQRESRLRELKQMAEPLKQERLRLEKEINRLTFEHAIANGDGDATSALQTMQQQLDKLHDEIAPLQAEMNQLTRQFWVTKEQVADNKYDLSASRYRQMEQDEEFYEEPQVTLERLLKLEEVMGTEAKELRGMIS